MGSNPARFSSNGQLLGLVLIVGVMNVPWVGGLLRLLIGLTGMGLLMTSVLEMWRSQRADYA